MTTIYGLQDPKTGTIRYVGRSRIPQARLAQHLRPWSLSTGKRLKRWLAGLRRQRRRPILVELQQCGDARAIFVEVEWIKRLNRPGHLLNVRLDLPRRYLG